MGADSRVTYSDCNAMSDPRLKLFVDTHAGVIGGTAGYAEHAVAFNVYIASLTDEELTAWTTDTRGVSKLFEEFTHFTEARNIKIVEQDNVLGHFMLASRHGAWCIEGGYVKDIQTYEAIGCGETSARPILYVQESMHKALDAACMFNIHCAYPLTFFAISRKSDEIRERSIIYPTGTYLSDDELWKDVST